MVFNQMWEKVHSERDWGVYPNEALVRWVFKTFGQGRTKYFLDLGAGQGANTWFLAREGFEVAAVDGSATAIEKARIRLSKEKLTCVTVACDLKEIPWADNDFDVAIDIVSSAHNEPHDMLCIVQEVARVLKPGGRFFMVTPTMNCSPEPILQYSPITFLAEGNLRLLLESWFDIVELTKTSYQPTSECTVEHWVVSAIKR